MNFNKPFALFVLSSFLLGACGTDTRSVLTDDGARTETIDTLVSDPSMRDEVVDRLLKTPDDRKALFAKILESEEIAGAMVDQLIASEHGKAVAASRIASDYQTTRTFIGMMMLTGGVGAIMSQRQAECLDLGEAFAHGNQERTMVDLKRLGRLIEEWARTNGGSYPVCEGFDDVARCLAPSLSNGALAGVHVNDAWGRPFRYHTDPRGTSYVLLSYANDGRDDGLGRTGPTSDYNADIVFSDGEFVQWPGNIRPESIQ